ncbi:DNA polymerase III subunit delta' [Sphingomicrobium flavum]|uniref:DNA polymerase III subunit delta' n=1 Tax=Sphingomicrobium flavum TaxID=1229164 RepID=UPI0021AD8F9D|nr:DNA polymerase III subunit delta' [Sphingomicrobium flavum]
MIEGQDAAVHQFLKAWRTGTPHHAWLLAGPMGVGKATFAKDIATHVLAAAVSGGDHGTGLEIISTGPTASLMEAGSHPDFRLIERQLNDKKTALKRNISVDQIRNIGKFLNVTASLSPWRVILIDSADDLEASGANALLKMLEEPPAHTLFMLVSHAPGRLLPTIKSRCRRLEFQPLKDDVMASVLRQQLPGKSADEFSALTELSQGSAGRAIAMAELDLASIVDQARAIMRRGDPTNAGRAALVQSLTNKANAERYARFLDIVPSLIAAEARTADPMQREALLEAYREVRQIAAVAPRLTLDPGSVVLRIGSKLAHAAPQPA